MSNATIFEMFSLPLNEIPDPDDRGFVTVDLPMIGKRDVHVSKITLDGNLPYIPEGELKPYIVFTPEQLHVNEEEKKAKAIVQELDRKEREKRDRVHSATSGYVPNSTETPKIGDIFVASWGWEQTNIDWYEVVGLTASGKSVRVRKICANKTATGSMVGTSLPVAGNFSGVIMTKRLSHYEGRPKFKLTEYSSAYAWEGDEKSYSSYA